MRVEVYKVLRAMMHWYNYKDIDFLSNDIIKEYYDRNLTCTDDELDAIKKVLKSDERQEALEEYLKDEYSKMNSDEIKNSFFDYIDNNVLDKTVFYSSGHIDVALDIMSDIDESKRESLVRLLNTDDIIDYINKDGKSKECLFQLFRIINNTRFMYDVLQKTENDVDRIKMLINSETDKLRLLELIDTPYFRTLIVCQQSEFVFEKEQLLSNVDEYVSYKTKFESLNTEKEKAEFITTIPDYDMRLDLLKKIDDRDNRDIVIESFDRFEKSDSRIKETAVLAQKMIREFFEDSLGDKFDDEKKEVLEIVFRRTLVEFENLQGNTNGRANHIFNTITISDRHENNINRIIGFLIHEYSHSLSYFNYRETGYAPHSTFEEGMADTFSDLVVNHYLEKHGKIELKGKKVRVDNPYTTYSGYDFENAWARTSLYGLQREGNDLEAVAEYVLGNKNKFAEMILGKEIANKKIQGGLKGPNLVTTYKEVYYSPNCDFSNIDFNSIYANRNFILNLFELQNRFNEKNKDIDVVGVSTQGKAYFADYIGKQYFDNRKIYEIPREELLEFRKLIVGLENPNDFKKSSVIDYNNYCDSKIKELTNEEIERYSFGILHSIPGLYPVINLSGTNLEKVLGKAFSRECKLVDEGQKLQESIRKYKRIIPDYLRIINPNNGDSDKYIYDFINDLKFTYIEQMRTAIESGNIEEVINALKDEKNEDIYIDSDLEDLFCEYGISIETKKKIIFSEDEVTRNVVKLVDSQLALEAQKQLYKESGLEKENPELK